jgi:hypothetical protein
MLPLVKVKAGLGTRPTRNELWKLARWSFGTLEGKAGMFRRREHLTEANLGASRVPTTATIGCLCFNKKVGGLGGRYCNLTPYTL